MKYTFKHIPSEERKFFVLLHLPVKGHSGRLKLPWSQAGAKLRSKLHKTGEDGLKEMLKKIQGADLSSFVHDLLTHLCFFLT